MIYRILGRTGLRVSEMGVGSTYFLNKNAEEMISIVSEAIKNGINYFDSFIYFDQTAFVSEFIKNNRKKLILAGHLGFEMFKKDYIILRDLKKSYDAFIRYLKRLKVDDVDIIYIHNVSAKEAKSIFDEGGLVDLAYQLKEEGYGRYIGISTHDTITCKLAIESDRIDVIMYPVNLLSHTSKGKVDINRLCQEKNIGLVAMKPFAGGKLMQNNMTIYHPENNNWSRISEITWEKLVERNEAVSPLKCISYVLNQPGVSCVVPGVSNVSELKDNLRYFNATDEELDFSELMLEFKDYASGQCVYCNHCLPCPVNIDVGDMNRRIDVALNELSKTKLKDNLYQQAISITSECILCNACSDKCPFGVDVVTKVEGFPHLYKRLVDIKMTEKK